MAQQLLLKAGSIAAAPGNVHGAVGSLEKVAKAHSRVLVAANSSRSSRDFLKQEFSVPSRIPLSKKKRSSSFSVNAVSEGAVTEAVSDSKESGPADENWVPVVPAKTLPKGERRLIRQGGEEIMLFWYKNEVYATESRSPAEGAYSEGLVNARLTQDGCIVCPSTASTFDLKTGDIREWYPTNAILRFLTPPLRRLIVYPVKMEGGFICINLKQQASQEDSTEIVFSKSSGGSVGETATEIQVELAEMIVDEKETGFGFNPKNELVNGRAAMFGFVALVVQELVTGKGPLGGLGALDYLYRVVPSLPLFK